MIWWLVFTKLFLGVPFWLFIMWYVTKTSFIAASGTVIPQISVNDISVFFFFLFIVFNFGRPRKFVNNVQMYQEMFKVFIFFFFLPPTKINEQ